jgi:hypothetical protein
MKDELQLNAVYLGSLSITLRGHKYSMKGMEGYCYREKEGGQMFIFQPDVQPEPETKDELLVWHKALTNLKMTPDEQKVYKNLLDGIRFRVHEDDLTLTR